MDQTGRAGRLDTNERLARFEGSNRSTGIDLGAIRRGFLGPDTPGLGIQDYDLDAIVRRSQGAGVPLDENYRRFARVRRDDGIEQMHAMARYDRQMRQAQTIDRINAGSLGTSTTAAQRFLESLPVLSPSNLPGDSQDCPICFERYHNRQHGENAVNLPCNHVLGKGCLLKWLTSSALNLNNNTCPMCRTVLFERHHVSLEDQLQDHHGVVDQVPGIHRPRVLNESPRVEGIMNQIRRDREHISAILREMSPPVREPVEQRDHFITGHPEVNDIIQRHEERGRRLEQLNDTNSVQRQMMARVREPVEIQSDFVTGYSEIDDMMQRHEERGRRLEQLNRTNSIQRQMLAPTREPAQIRHGVGSEFSGIAQRHEERGRRLEQQLNHPNATLQEMWARARQPARLPDGLATGHAVMGDDTSQQSREQERLLQQLNRSETELYELMARSRERERVRDGLGDGIAGIGDRIDGVGARMRARAHNMEYDGRRSGGL
ncbi:MAG: hypothetical protein ASARMPREDX12_006835 [Alectoria sarmentosa]|nr:MAG: hypothetical protein ASARMPREDX12_006835 [Alectoria sarmentosa]